MLAILRETARLEIREELAREREAQTRLLQEAQKKLAEIGQTAAPDSGAQASVGDRRSELTQAIAEVDGLLGRVDDLKA